MRVSLVLIKFIAPFTVVAAIFCVVTILFINFNIEGMTRQMLTLNVRSTLWDSAQKHFDNKLNDSNHAELIQAWTSQYQQGVHDLRINAVTLWNADKQVIYTTEAFPAEQIQASLQSQYEHAATGEVVVESLGTNTGSITGLNLKDFRVYLPIMDHHTGVLQGVVQADVNFEESLLQYLQERASQLSIFMAVWFLLLGGLIVLNVYFFIVYPIKNLERKVQAFAKKGLF